MNKLWTVVVHFLSPTEGMATLSAATPEEAAELAKELFKFEKEVAVVQVYESPQQELFVLQDDGVIN